jgi:hypothetical protein
MLYLFLNTTLELQQANELIHTPNILLIIIL